PTSAAPARAATARMGSASAACISAPSAPLRVVRSSPGSVAATAASADGGAAARRLLRIERLVEGAGGAGIGAQRHVRAREVAALVGRDGGAGRERGEQRQGRGALHAGSFSSPSISFARSLAVSSVKP